MRGEIIRILQILSCIMIGLPGIYAVLRSNKAAVRATSACITLLGLIFSREIGCLIFELLVILLKAVFMISAYIFIILLAGIVAFSPLILVLKWFFGK